MDTSPSDRHSPSPQSRRAWRSPAAWLVLLLVLALGLALDLGSKYWTFNNVADDPVVLDRESLLSHPTIDPIPPHEGIAVLPGGLLKFRLVINRGAVFGIGEHRRMFFIAFTVMALVAGLFIFARYTRAHEKLAHVGLALVLAGGLGNLYDRMVYGVVRDFLYMLAGWELPFGLRWPRIFGGSPEVFPWVFNIADVMLLCGMALLLVHINRVEKNRAKCESESGAESGAVEA